MSSLEKAKTLLNENNYTLVLIKDDDIISSQLNGIKPLLGLLGEGKNLTGYSLADKIIGKAQAMLIIKAKIYEVFGKIMTKNAKEMLEKNGIKVTFETLTDKIINRTGTDICPMEKAVMDIEDIDEGYKALEETVKKLSQKN